MEEKQTIRESMKRYLFRQKQLQQAAWTPLHLAGGRHAPFQTITQTQSDDIDLDINTTWDEAKIQKFIAAPQRQKKEGDQKNTTVLGAFVNAERYRNRYRRLQGYEHRIKMPPKQQALKNTPIQIQRLDGTDRYSFIKEKTRQENPQVQKKSSRIQRYAQQVDAIRLLPTNGGIFPIARETAIQKYIEMRIDAEKNSSQDDANWTGRRAPIPAGNVSYFGTMERMGMPRWGTGELYRRSIAEQGDIHRSLSRRTASGQNPERTIYTGGIGDTFASSSAESTHRIHEIGKQRQRNGGLRGNAGALSMRERLTTGQERLGQRKEQRIERARTFGSTMPPIAAGNYGESFAIQSQHTATSIHSSYPLNRRANEPAMNRENAKRGWTSRILQDQEAYEPTYNWKNELPSLSADSRSTAAIEMKNEFHISGNEFISKTEADPLTLAEQIGWQIANEIESSASGWYR